MQCRHSDNLISQNLDFTFWLVIQKQQNQRCRRRDDRGPSSQSLTKLRILDWSLGEAKLVTLNPEESLRYGDFSYVADGLDPEYRNITVLLPYRWNQSSIDFDAQKECYDTKSLFGYSTTGYGPSTANLYGCAAIATSAFLVQSEKIIIDKTVNETISTVNLDSLKDFNATRVFDQIVGCIEQSCVGVNPLGECDASVAKLTQSQVKADELDKVLEPLQDLCSVLSKAPEADIAGPGVVFQAFSQAYRDRDGPPTLDLSALALDSFLCRLVLNHDRVPRNTGFFVMAIETATLTMVIMNNQSLAIRVDVGAAKVFASANTLLVLITQAIMQRRVYVLCSIIQMLSLPTPSALSSPDLKYKACGGRQSILQTCVQAEYGDYYLYGGYLQSSDQSIKFFIYTSIMVFLTADHLGHVPRLRKMMASATKALRGREIQIPAWVLKTFSVLGKILWFLLVALMAYTLLFNIVQVHRFVRPTMHSKKQWTFGQVVAVLVWAPVLSKYIYYSIFGIELGVGKRIDDQYKVVLNEEKTPSTPPGAQGRFDSSRSLVDEIFKMVAFDILSNVPA
ncbi:hypothetical protein CSAL01_04907 [Colletotrichum salicis]|uniref:Uncharacterized protein n=1 Tax=Colletotrichum salicis TaxID=1209931 RepID=A0A135TC56_9PEZI|nr:hypothetical protein CSAL01_04907 [Colletotrichum salicis]